MKPPVKLEMRSQAHFVAKGWEFYARVFIIINIAHNLCLLLHMYTAKFFGKLFLEFFEEKNSWNFVLKIRLPHLNRPS